MVALSSCLLDESLLQAPLRAASVATETKAARTAAVKIDLLDDHDAGAGGGGGGGGDADADAAAAATTTGPMPPAASPFYLHNTPLLVTHGTKDTTVPLRTCRAHFDYLVRHNRSSHATMHMTFKTFDKRHEMINGPIEAKVVVKFFAEHLALRMVGLENQSDVYEVSM